MPANEFEKQVQGELDNFELNPSPSVWKKVEEHIRKKKRRRVIAFFLLFAALLTSGYYAYYLLRPDKTRSESPVSVVSSPNNDKGGTKQTDHRVTPPIDSLHHDISIKGNKIEPSDESTARLPGKPPNTTQTNSANMEVVTQTSRVTTKQKQESVRHDLAPTKPNEEIPAVRRKQEANSESELSVVSNKPGTAAVDKIQPAKAGVVEQRDQPANSSEGQPQESTTAKADENKNTTPPVQSLSQPIRLPKAKYRIKWGIDFSAGVTSNQGDVFSFAKSAGRSYSVSGVVGSPATGVFAMPGSPSAIKPGPAFSMGVSAELQLSPRSRVSSGINYSYASNRIMKGGLVYALVPVQPSSNLSATRVDQVYHGSPQEYYTNGYHFLSLPLQYHWQLNGSKKLPVEWTLGTSFSYLVGTNALVFSSSYGGIYYRDKDVITKFHVSLGTGITVRLRPANGTEWVLGPEVYFDTRRLVDDGQAMHQYLLFTGLNAKMYFGHKKRGSMQRSSSK